MKTMTAVLRDLACLLLLTVVATSHGAPLPNILYILLDDFGWAEAGWHADNDESARSLTPNMEELMAEGIELDRHYVFKYCSPTRSAIQSGRNPIHVNVLNLDGAWFNPKDPVGGYTEIPPAMTGIAEHMLTAGYNTHYYGKWHAGMAKHKQTPQGRGYEKTLHYFGGLNDYWTSEQGRCRPNGQEVAMYDLWDTDGPAFKERNPAGCGQWNQKNCKYEDYLFYEKVRDAIQTRDENKPFFIFWSPHIVHLPLQVPDEALSLFSSIENEERRKSHAMIFWIDQRIGEIANLIKDSDLWDNTLIVVHADNGGAIWAGSNNYPLKGGKRSNWEGGIRANAFVTGGLLPSKVRGSKETGLIAAWDWFATFAALAGVDPTDKSAAAVGLPPIDSVNMWPLLSGEVNESPREDLFIGDTEEVNEHHFSHTRVGGVIAGRYKVLVGALSQSGWTSPNFPNSSSNWDPQSAWNTCGVEEHNGCLFDIYEDPGEHKNLAKEKPELFHSLMGRIQHAEKNAFSPDRGSPDKRACYYALNKYHGYWGPYDLVDEGGLKFGQVAEDLSLAVGMKSRGNGRRGNRHRDNRSHRGPHITGFSTSSSLLQEDGVVSGQAPTMCSSIPRFCE